MHMKSTYLQTRLLIPVCMELALIIYLITTLRLAPPMVDGMLSESSFPLLIFLVATPAAMKLFFDNLKSIREEIKMAEVHGQQIPKKHRSLKPVMTILVMAVFILAFRILGFTILAPLYVFFLMLIFDDKPQHIGKKILYALLITAMVYVLYVIMFDIRFPELWR